ncbi:MAG: hypothetical protein JWP94_2852 [Mucilaginibacter sp.]|nr:hypothetical protein [Mucilaginibacter sp.]
METQIKDANPKHNGRTMAGIIILIIGGMLLIDQLDLFFIPHWLFSWPMWLIGYGLYMGGKHNFRKPVWAVLIFIGTMFLFTENVHNADRIVWPIGIIATGLYLVMRQNRKVEATYPDNNYKV